MIDEFVAARDALLEHRSDWAAATAAFRWPRLERFNWALDFFDRVPPRDAPALRVVSADGSVEESSFGDLSRRSDQVASYLGSAGLGAGDRLLVCLDNVTPLWEVMLAAIKLRLVVVPASPLLTAEDLAERLSRAEVSAVVAGAEMVSRFPAAPAKLAVCVGGQAAGWRSYEETRECDTRFEVAGEQSPGDPLLLYFTSGTTAQPKMVEHSHASYPVGHLSTMYVLGLRPGDVHLNISSPGWAKHAWSCVFAPWNAEATVLVHNYERFEPRALLDVLVSQGVTSLCAPPTVWRLLVQEPLERYPVALRELLSAGEPLNPEIIEHVRDRWGLTIRDLYGQTETTALIGNSPGAAIKVGSMGRPLPGYDIAVLDAAGRPADEGEICVRLPPGDRPLGVMSGYRGDPTRTSEAMRDGYFHTGDMASVDADGYLTFVGRGDDVFKASDYRISPFELESVLIEHPAVAEAAVVPSPDRRRSAVPKAFVQLSAGWAASPETASAILAHSRERLAPYQRVRRLEFAALPKTISGKIRRVELRRLEAAREGTLTRRDGEYWETDFVAAAREETSAVGEPA